MFVSLDFGPTSFGQQEGKQTPANERLHLDVR